MPDSEGIYAIFDGDICLLVGESWNLKGRLLELMNILQDIGEFQVNYELCLDEERLARKDHLATELRGSSGTVDLPSRDLPGISFWNSLSR